MDITKKKVIFIDMDGTLIDTVSGKTFPEGVWDMELKMEVLRNSRNFIHRLFLSYLIRVELNWDTFIPLCSNRNSSTSLRAFNRTSV